MKFIFLWVLLCASATAQSNLDQFLLRYTQQFNITALTPVSKENPKLYNLGESLYFEDNLSGNKNINCSTCHDPSLATGDGLPVNIGEGSVLLNNRRVITKTHQIGPRNTPALYNTGDKKLEIMFWDGRVSYRSDWEEFTTPEEALNGDYPERWDITDVLDGALAAQVIFPLVTDQEMMGQAGSNEIAKAQDNLTRWDLLTKRILGMPKYKKALNDAFPKVKQFNIGHIGRALAEYIRVEFSRTSTPWDRYLRGDKAAMSADEKRGAVLFFSRGRCIVCHTGPHLGGEVFMGVASPQIGPGKDIKHNDEGRFLITGRDSDRYKFRVPPLRNVALTAPYFHSGAYQTLSDVLDHYVGGVDSIDTYNDAWLDTLNSIFGERLFVETNHYMLFKKKDHAHMSMRNNMINLNEQQKSWMLKFLEISLTEK